MSQMLVASPNAGTKTVTWDPSDEASVESVKQEFEKIIKSNFAYVETPAGGKEQIHQFDPKAETIFVTGPLVGG